MSINVCFIGTDSPDGLIFLSGKATALHDFTIDGKTVSDHLTDYYSPHGIILCNETSLRMVDSYIPAPEDIKLLADIQEPAILTDSDNNLLALHNAFSRQEAQISLIAQHPFYRLKYPWDLLMLNELIQSRRYPDFHPDQVHPLAAVSGNVKLGAGTKILPGVVIEGNVTIGENCKIGPNCYIRGSVSIGNNCIIGQSVEIKSSIIGNTTFISHLTYVGDSIIGSNVNIGAGCTCSNFRHDEANHRVMLNDRLIDSGRDKLGAMIGNNVKLGCHTIIYPGRIVHAHCTTLPGEIVSKNIQA